MSKFLTNEKMRYLTNIGQPESHTGTLPRDGIYRGLSRPFCLPQDRASDNLFSAIRQPAMDFFAERSIKWHDGQDRQPSNHLCDSQVSCVNFLFPFVRERDALAKLLRPLFPTLREVVSFDDDAYLAFEWIGERDYLGEKEHANNKTRSRGANCTSADAAVLFDRDDGRRQMVLIEWKYTETYSSTPFHIGPSGTRRLGTYLRWLQASDSPIIELPDYKVLYYEPFYQLMRQQLLAAKMEQAHELGADVVSLLHVAPAANTGFQRVTSPGLRGQGTTVTEVWRSLLRQPDRFRSIATEDLFGSVPALELGLAPWWEYITDRYAWVSEARPISR